MGPNSGFLASLIHAVSTYLIPFFCFISSYISRLQRFGCSLKKKDKDIIFVESEKRPSPESLAEKDVSERGDKSELHLKFKFPTFEEINKIQKERGNSSGNASKYEFSSEKSSFSAFIQVLTNFPVKDISGDRIVDFSENDEVSSGRKFVKVEEETGGVKEEEELIVGLDGEENGKIGKKTESVQEGEEFRGNQDFLDESELCSEKNDDGFLSDGDFGEELDIDGEKERIGLESDPSGFGESKEWPEYFADEESDIKKVEERNLQNPVGLNSDFLSEKDFNEDSDSKSDAGFVSKHGVGLKGGDNSEKTKQNDLLMSDSGDANKLESLWEHQELIEQLQMELRKVKATGLPTILEESESPKIMDDLKHWKIDDKVQHEDCMGELHKFYRSYREMMRKFDILNYQKMYAMGFLQLKDPFQSTSQQKPSAPTLKSLVSQNLWLFKHKSHSSDPIKKFINELQGDLEVVYVGQMSLSWEFLHWQYEKALDLWKSDPPGIHRYNEVAGEFQQFQVLMQRFTEDQPFQGPRVQSYVKSRCVLRNLLQVPVIREDCLEDKNKGRKKEKDEYVITSEILVEMVEESIRIFWRFVRSDKDCTTVSSSSYKKMPELQSPEDFKLLLEVRKILLKKERKLKDILRSENCILRKFRHSREDDSDQALHFFAQVDLKLVSRVLNMSKISRDQLIWCQNKLSRISFVNRKIYVEPSFLLFPC